MLTIQPVLNVFIDVNLIDNLVCIVLKSCCEYHNFVEFRHQLNEIHTAWSHKEVTIASIFNIVDERFIQV